MKVSTDLFIMGVMLGWGPCLNFCAPIVLPYIAASQRGWFRGFRAVLAFSLARILPYMVLALLASGIGRFLLERYYRNTFGVYIHGLAGLFIVIAGLLLLTGKTPHLNFCLRQRRLGQRRGNALGQTERSTEVKTPEAKTPEAKTVDEDRNDDSIKGLILLGLLVGFAPCVPLLGVLSYVALVSQSALQGLFYGACFGTGTLVSPLILIGTLTGGLPTVIFRKPAIYKFFSRICAIFLVYLGIRLLISAFHYCPD